MYTPTINSNVVYEFHSFVLLLTLFFFSFQMNTFQVVIITDGVYSFVMYNYPEGGIQWSAPTSVLVIPITLKSRFKYEIFPFPV